jgi:NAD(P)-dependent dehydrogenase (short-subunit alcohol dehydrogenase family)
VRGLLFTVQKALPLMTKGSSVILTGSIAPINGFLSLSVYNASKAAVRSFARSWIVDLKGRDIRVATVPLGRTGTPYDLGKPAVFLASDDSAYATGIELFVDGGVGQI